MGRTDWYVRFPPHVATAASCRAPLRAKSSFTSQARRSAARRPCFSESETAFAIAFQQPRACSGPVHRAAIAAPDFFELERITFSAACLYVAEEGSPRG